VAYTVRNGLALLMVKSPVRVTAPVERVIVSGEDIYDPASSYDARIKFEPALAPDSAVPSAPNIVHLATPAVLKRKARFDADVPLMSSLDSPLDADTIRVGDAFAIVTLLITFPVSVDVPVTDRVDERDKDVPDKEPVRVPPVKANRVLIAVSTSSANVSKCPAISTLELSSGYSRLKFAVVGIIIFYHSVSLLLHYEDNEHEQCLILLNLRRQALRMVRSSARVGAGNDTRAGC
jgi:hypothetical protein